MTINVTCSGCEETYQLPDEVLGNQIRCRQCSTPIDVVPDDVCANGIPQKAKEAILGLAVAGLMWCVFGGMGIYLMQTDGLDAFGRGFTYYLFSMGLGGFVCSFLLWKKVAAAKPLAMIMPAFYLVFFPIGTIVGYIIYRGLFSKDMDRYLTS